MSEGAAPRTGELLRRIGQLVAYSPESAPEIRIGDPDRLREQSQALGIPFPVELATMLTESDPVAFTVPLPGEDIDFISLEDVSDVARDEGLPTGLLPFGRVGKAILAIDAREMGAGADRGPVVAARKVGAEWELEPAASSLEGFLVTLVGILSWFRDTEGGDADGEEPYYSRELTPEQLAQIEQVVQRLDPDNTDFWMSVLA